MSLPVQYLESPLDNIPERSIAPDFVDGHAFGDAIGVALRNNDNRAWLDVTGLESSQVLKALECLSISLNISGT